MHVHRPPPGIGSISLVALDDTGSDRPLIYRDDLGRIFDFENYENYEHWGHNTLLHTANGFVERRSIWLKMEWKNPPPEERSATDPFWEFFHVDMLKDSFDPGSMRLSGMSMRTHLFVSSSPFNRGRLAVADTAYGAYKNVKDNDHPDPPM